MANVRQSNQAGSNSASRPVKKVGTGYTNLQSLLNASNAGALGNTLSQNVSQNVGKTVGNIQGAQQEFKQGAQQEQGRLSGLQSGAEGALNKIINAPSTTSYSVDEQGNPVQNLIGQPEVQNYADYVGSKYQGPSDINNAANLQKQANTSQQYARMLGSQPGQQQLLRSFVSNPKYTNTLQNLDSLHLGKQNIQSGLKNARSQALQRLAGSNVGDMSASAQQQARQNMANLSQQQQGLQRATQGAVGGINEQLSNRLSQLQDQSQVQEALGLKLRQGDFSALTPEQRGVAEAYGKYNILDPQTLINIQNAQNLSQEGVANQQQAAQLAALGKLMNDPNLNLGGNVGTAQAANVNIGDFVGDAQQRASADRAIKMNNMLSGLNLNLATGVTPGQQIPAYMNTQQRDQLLQAGRSLQPLAGGKYYGMSADQLAQELQGMSPWGSGQSNQSIAYNPIKQYVDTLNSILNTKYGLTSGGGLSGDSGYRS